MATVNGDVEITLGSEDPINLQLLEDDGVTPINLEQITALTLYMRNTDDGSLKEITEAGDKLVVTDGQNGKIKLSQDAADFPAAASYRYKIKFVAPGSKQHFVPDGSKWYTFTVYDII